MLMKNLVKLEAKLSFLKAKQRLSGQSTLIIFSNCTHFFITEWQTPNCTSRFPNPEDG